MHGRRVYHARGKVLGGSSSINGMIFQRGNPLDYERWGFEEWDYAHCLPYFKKMETCLAGADEWRGGDGPIVLERGPASSPLFGAFFEAAQQAGYELTDDVNGYRQEGFAAFDRTIHRGRRLSAARAYLHPAHVATEPRGADGRLRRARSCSRARARPASSSRAERSCRRTRSSSAAARSTRRSCSSSRASATRGSSSRSASTSSTTCPPSARTSRTTSRSTSSTRATQPVSVQPALKKWRRPEIGARWLFLRSGPGATNHFEAGGFVRSNDDVAYPNLMFHFLPLAIRYDGSQPAAKHGYQVHVGPMYSDVRGSVKITSADPRVAPGAALQLPLDAERPARVGRGDPRRPLDPRPARVRPVRRRRALAGAVGAERRGDPGLGGAGRRDGAAPVVHLCDGRRRRRSGDDARPRARRDPRRRRLRLSRSSPTGTSTRP